MSELVVEIAATDFEAIVLKSSQPVLVDFWAPWCGPCKLIATLLENVALDRPQLRVVKLNVDEAKAIADKYHIRSIPTLMLFHAGKPRGTKIGAITLSDLNKFLDTYAS